MTIFEKWNNTIDVKGLQTDIEEAEKSQGDYQEVPIGTYECKIEKMELVESSTNKPMVSIWFRILKGDYENNMMFMNQVVTEGFQFSIVNRFLKSLEAIDDDTVKFEDYEQYNNLLMDIMEAIDKKLEYLVEKKVKKGFPVYTIKEVYEV